MRKSIIIAFVAAFVIAFTISTFYFNSSAEIILNAPDTAEIGELVILDASNSNAASFEWKVIPETPDFKIIEDGERAFFSSSVNGKYLFIVAAAKGSKVDCIVHRIIVKEKIKDDFVEMVKSWLPEKNDPVLLNALARSFEESANAKDIETLINTTAIANRVVLGDNLDLYKPFLEAFSDYLIANYQDKSLEEHIELWLKVAKSLRC